MLNWFKHLFGWAGAELTLVERHAEASALAANARSAFDGIVADLRNAHGKLNAVADEAEEQAKALVSRANGARAEAAQHLNAADKIAGLLS